MSYYMTGDYYGTMGDPGIFGAIKGAIGGFISGGPLGAIGGAVSGLRGTPRARSVTPMALEVPRGTPGAVKAPGVGGAIARILPGGKTGYIAGKRRRMNPANPRALRRAIRRQAGFVKLARRALKGTGYSIVSRASRRPKYNVREAGPGGVTIQ